MDLLHNPYRGEGLPARADFARGRVESDPASALALHARCPVASAAPLLEPVGPVGPASEVDVGSVHLKDERARMRLGSFKALGASDAIAPDASARLREQGAGVARWGATYGQSAFDSGAGVRHHRGVGDR